MSVVAAAVIGSAVVGGVASKKAADKAADASKKGIASTESLANQARTDAINLFQQSKVSAQNGIGSALNFYQQNAQAKINPFVQGNVAAQQVLGQGATQANNAILGLPVDMSFANQPTTLGADYSGITSAQMPTLGAGALTQEPVVAPQAQTMIGVGNPSGVLGRIGSPTTFSNGRTPASMFRR